MQYIKIDAKTGKQIEWITLSEVADYVINNSDEFPLIEGTASPTAYYLDGEFVERPKFNLAADKQNISCNGIETIKITGVPGGEFQVNLWGAVCESWTQDGDIELTVNLPGAYRVQVSQWPYIDQEVTFYAS